MSSTVATALNIDSYSKKYMLAEKKNSSSCCLIAFTIHLMLYFVFFPDLMNESPPVCFHFLIKI